MLDLNSVTCLVKEPTQESIMESSVECNKTQPASIGSTEPKKALTGCLWRKGKRKVSKPFRVHLCTVVVRVIYFEDSPEDIESRSKYWEFQASNRDRFYQRIKRTEEIISPILSNEHRTKMFDQRFQPKDNE